MEGQAEQTGGEGFGDGQFFGAGVAGEDFVTVQRRVVPAAGLYVGGSHARDDAGQVHARRQQDGQLRQRAGEFVARKMRGGDDGIAAFFLQRIQTGAHDGAAARLARLPVFQRGQGDGGVVFAHFGVGAGEDGFATATAADAEVAAAAQALNKGGVMAGNRTAFACGQDFGGVQAVGDVDVGGTGLRAERGGGIDEHGNFGGGAEGFPGGKFADAAEGADGYDGGDMVVARGLADGVRGKLPGGRVDVENERDVARGEHGLRRADKGGGGHGNARADGADAFPQPEGDGGGGVAGGDGVRGVRQTSDAPGEFLFQRAEVGVVARGVDFAQPGQQGVGVRHLRHQQGDGAVGSGRGGGFARGHGGGLSSRISTTARSRRGCL